MLNLGWFSTGRGPGSRALLSTVQEAITDGRIQARISFVFSNRAPGEAEGSDQFFALANSLGLTVVSTGLPGHFAAIGPATRHNGASLTTKKSPS